MDDLGRRQRLGAVGAQSNGFGNGRLVTFAYLQNFDCVDEPPLDLDFNGIKAQSDPNEMQTPICQVVTEPERDPTGGDLKHIALRAGKSVRKARSSRC